MNNMFNITVYNGRMEEVARYVDVGPSKLMELALDMQCYSATFRLGLHECVKGYISVSYTESFK